MTPRWTRRGQHTYSADCDGSAARQVAKMVCVDRLRDVPLFPLSRRPIEFTCCGMLLFVIACINILPRWIAFLLKSVPCGGRTDDRTSEERAANGRTGLQSGAAAILLQPAPSSLIIISSSSAAARRATRPPPPQPRRLGGARTAAAARPAATHERVVMPRCRVPSRQRGEALERRRAERASDGGGRRTAGRARGWVAA
jgi:hypothetical protein